MIHSSLRSSFFFFNDTATTEIYTLSLHDALPILREGINPRAADCTTSNAISSRITASSPVTPNPCPSGSHCNQGFGRSEEHTSELQSRSDLVCRLLLEKKKTQRIPLYTEMYSTVY